MFTKKNTLVNCWLALLLLATSLAWSPRNALAKTAVASPPASPKELSLELTSVQGDCIKDQVGCGGGWYYRPRLRPSFSFFVAHSLLFVDGVRFARNHRFNVRVRRPGGKFENLGQARAASNGRITDTFSLPKKLQRAPRLYVCLKDIVNGRTYCGWARRVY